MLLLREVPEGQPYYLVRTEHGSYELCIQENGIKITLPESQDFLQELSWDQFGGLTAHLAEEDQIAYTEDSETLEQQENMYRLLPWFPALWEEYSEILKRKSFGRKEEPLSRQKARKKPEIIITQKGGCSLPVGIKAGIRKYPGNPYLKNTGAGREKCHKRRTGNSCGVCRVGRAAKCF